MSGVALDDHRAARGERRDGVAPGRGEGEREVARTPDGDRAKGHPAQPQVRFGQRGAVGERGVEAQAEEVAAADDVGEQSGLGGGAAPFAEDPSLGEPGLELNSVGQRLAEDLDLLGDRGEEIGTIVQRTSPVCRERGGRRGARLGDKVRGRCPKGRIDGIPGRRGPGVKGRSLARNTPAGDDGDSDDVHGGNVALACLATAAGGTARGGDEPQ